MYISEEKLVSVIRNMRTNSISIIYYKDYKFCMCALRTCNENNK